MDCNASSFLGTYVNCEIWEVTEIINLLNLAVPQWALPIVAAWEGLCGVRRKLILFKRLSPDVSDTAGSTCP